MSVLKAFHHQARGAVEFSVKHINSKPAPAARSSETSTLAPLMRIDDTAASTA
jgi:hypothetical protein